jgi:DNA-binding transcriptional ArsR family regulator
VTKHLAILQRAGLVRSERRGRERRFTLHRAPLDDARTVLGQIARQWDAAIDRLRAHVER